MTASQPDVAGAVLALDQAMIALAVAKSTLLGEVGPPVPLASLRGREHYTAASAAEVAEGVDAPPTCDSGRLGYGYACNAAQGHEGPHAFVSPTSGVMNIWPVPSGYLPQHTGGHPDCTAPGCGQPGHHLHAATIPADGA